MPQQHSHGKLQPAIATLFLFSHLLVQVIRKTSKTRKLSLQSRIQTCFCQQPDCSEMKGAAALALLLAVVHLSCPCEKLGRTLVCRDVPSFFEAGCLFLFMSLQHVGVINSTVFKSDNLSSVTKFIISNAGVTGIVENAFSSFHNLTDINVEGNMLSQISTNWFGDPAILSRARLTGNRIEVVNASTLVGFTNLTHLQLNKNRIKTIHPNGFISQSMLAQLDLSQNRLTWISPQVFRSLRSLRSIRLDGNPWNCSCDAEEFVASIKELHRRSQLDREMEVTCETPPPLKGQPVWKVSVCPTSPPTTPPMTTTENPPTPPTSSAETMMTRPLQPSSKTETTAVVDATTAASSHTAKPPPSETSVQTKLTDVPNTVPVSSAKAVTTAPWQPSSKTDTSVQSGLDWTDAPTTVYSHSETSVQTKPPDHPTTVPEPAAKVVTTSPWQPSPMIETSVQSKPAPVSSHAAMASSSEASVQSKPTDAPSTVPEPTAEAVTTSPSQSETSFQPKSTDAPTTVSPHTGTNGTSSPSDQHTSVHLTDAYIVCTLIAVIAVLCVLLFTVCFLLHRRKRGNKTVTPGFPREEKTELEDDKSLSHGHSPASSADRDPEVARRRSFTGVRAKSANAVILTSSFRLSEKDPPSGEGKQKLGTEDEAQTGAEGGIQMDNLVAMDPVKEGDRQDDGKLVENPERLYVNTDTVPYLSIGTVQSKISPDEESTEHPGQTPQMEKVLGRISTWPPTAPEWQVRCKNKEDDEDEGFAVWTQKEALKLLGEVEKIVDSREHPIGSGQHEEEDEAEARLTWRRSQPSSANEPSVSEAQPHSDSATEEQGVPEPATATLTSAEICENQEEKSSGNQLEKSCSVEGRTQKDPKRVVTGRRRAERGAASSKVTSGGTSPDDETLLSGNSYAFMDLLHEVSQNHGRWTRERWKQLHANKQRR